MKRFVRQGIIPRILEKLLGERRAARQHQAAATTDNERAMWNAMQLALKTACNSLYGMMVAGGLLDYREIGHSITAGGKALLHRAIDLAVEHFGVTVLYGDTDSIMVVRDDIKDIGAAFALMNEMAAKITSVIDRHPVKLEAEKVLFPYLLLNKKRYAGMYHLQGKDPWLFFKGVETARRDNCTYAAQTITEAVKILMEQRNTGAVVRYVHERVAKLVSGQVPMDQLVISQSMAKSNYVGLQRHVEAAKRARKADSSYDLGVGDRVPYVFCRSQDSKVSGCTYDPVQALREKHPIDAARYLDTQLAKPLGRLLCLPMASAQSTRHLNTIGNELARRMADAEAAQALLGKVPPQLAVGVAKTHANMKVVLKEMMKHTSEQLLAPRHSAPRPKIAASSKRGIAAFFRPTRTCSACKATITPGTKGPLCATCADGDAGLHLVADIEEIEQDIGRLQRRCARCLDDPDFSADAEFTCVARDCANLFRLVEQQRKLAELRGE